MGRLSFSEDTFSSCIIGDWLSFSYDDRLLCARSFFWSSPSEDCVSASFVSNGLLSSDGKESVVHIIKPLNSFADIPLFEGTDYPVTAKCLEESLVLCISKEGFLELIYENPEISLRMLAGFAKRLKAMVNQVEDLTSKEIPNRLAKYILKEIKTAGTEKLAEPFVKLSVPKTTIAAYLGTITETLSRSLKKLQDEGVIRVNGKSIFVNDIKRLKDLAK
mgnify:CR=1 FL=1